MMNERQPYEKLIADKLQQLRGPDVDASWQQMKRLLDDDQRPKGGGGRNGPNGWWRVAMVAVVLTAGLFFYVQNRKPAAKDVTTVQQANENGTSVLADNNNTNNKTTSTEKKSTPANALVKNDNAKKDNGRKLTPVSIETLNTGKDVKAKDNAGDNNTVHNDAANNNKNVLPIASNGNGSITNKEVNKKNTIADVPDNRLATVPNTNNNNKLVKNNRPPFINNGNNRSAPYQKNKTDNTDKSKDGVTNDAVAGNNKDGRRINPRRELGTNQDDVVKNSNDINTGTSGNHSNNVPAGKTGDATTTETFAEKWSGLSLPYLYTKDINASSLAGDSIAASHDVSKVLSKETKERALKSKIAEQQAVAAKRKKSFNLNLGDVFLPFSLKRDGEPWWAVGLSLNSSVAVGAQSSYNYNVNAKSGTLTDYLPSPYVQYHMNDNVYVQTELNLSTPQHVPQLLIAQSTIALPASQSQLQTSTYIQKLYYFNWPFSLHYSPVKNLFIAGGLQFSSLQSGVALQEKREVTSGGTYGTPSSFIYKFKDDTTAAKLSPTEWRWETGADYYWNRFTLGIRYNKALKDAIKVNVPGVLPLTTNRNSSFLLFMKYNLFEGRNKDNAGQSRSLTRY